MNKRKLLLQEEQYNYMFAIPPKVGRYIVLDTETTGLNYRLDHIIELAAHEISNGRLTGCQFHIYIKPRMVMTQSVINIHKMDNTFYDDYYINTYESERNLMENFVRFVGTSLIFAHNAPFDMSFINNELRHFNLPPLNSEKFRCAMRIFRNVTSVINPEYYVKCNLSKCCEYFNLKRNNYQFHTAIYDSMMTAKMLCKMFDIVDSSKKLKDNKKINYMSNTIEQFLDKKENNDLNSLISKFNEIKSDINKNKSIKKRRKGQLKINESISNMSDLMNTINKNKAKYKEERKLNNHTIHNKSLLTDSNLTLNDQSDNKNTTNSNDKEIKINYNNSSLELSLYESMVDLTDEDIAFAIENNI